MSYRITLDQPPNVNFLYDDLTKVVRKVRTLQRNDRSFTVVDEGTGAVLSAADLDRLFENKR